MINLKKGYLCADGRFPPYIDSKNYITHRFIYGRGSVIGCLYRRGDMLPSAIFIDKKFLEDKSPIIQEPPRPTPKETPKPTRNEIRQEYNSETGISFEDAIEGMPEFLCGLGFDEDDNYNINRRITNWSKRHRIITIGEYEVIINIYTGEVCANRNSRFGTKRKRYKSVQRFFEKFADDFTIYNPNLAASYMESTILKSRHMHHLEVIWEVLERCREVCNNCGIF